MAFDEVLATRIRNSLSRIFRCKGQANQHSLSRIVRCKGQADEHSPKSVVDLQQAVTEKKMFGGMAFLLNGNLLLGVWQNSLVVRFEKSQHDAVLQQPNVRPFDITGKKMTGWALIEPEGMETDFELDEWTRFAFDYVSTLPVKQ